MICPIQIDLLAVVRDRIPLLSRVPSLRDEISVLVVTTEEAVEMVENLDGLLVPSDGAGRSFLELLVLPHERGIAQFRLDIAVRVEGVWAEVRVDLLDCVVEFVEGSRIALVLLFGEFFFDVAWEVG